MLDQKTLVSPTEMAWEKYNWETSSFKVYKTT